MSSVSLPPSTFNGPVTFKDTVTMLQHPSGRQALTLIGANGSFQIMQTYDFALNPIHGIATVNGDSVFGDRRNVYGPGDVFNSIFTILGNVVDNLSATAGGFKAGHGAGQSALYFGIGAPSAIHPVTNGIPANGVCYLRWDGGVGTTLYQVRAAAWVGIL